MAYMPSEHFDAAANYLSKSSSLSTVSNDVKLELYALFKCITVSKTPSKPRPSLFDFTGRAKWDAWNVLGNHPDGADPQTLEKRYIEIAQSLGWKDKTHPTSLDSSEVDSRDEEETGSSNGGGGGMGTVVSVMRQPPPDPNDDGTVHAFALSNDSEGLLAFLNSQPHADLNVRDEYGYTPLHLAADRGHATIVKILVENHADASLEDVDGFTALALAEVGNHQGIIEILQGCAPGNTEKSDAVATGCSSHSKLTFTESVV